jgi:hypothetical protein
MNFGITNLLESGFGTGNDYLLTGSDMVTSRPVESPAGGGGKSAINHFRMIFNNADLAGVSGGGNNSASQPRMTSRKSIDIGASPD